MLNMMQLRDYPMDINSFNYDVSSMINNIYVGPQGELLESINRFNQHYGTNIEITKQFTLKPGGYDKIKTAYSNYVLRWDMRPRGIASIFKRINDYRWRADAMKNDAIRLEQRMMDLRMTGIGWQDNTEDFVRETDKLKDIIISSMETCKDLYPNVDISVKLIPSITGRAADRSRHNYSSGRESFPELGSPDLQNPSEYIIVFYVHIKDPEMTVHILNADETVEKYTFPCHDIIVASGTYFLPMVSRNWGREVLRTDNVSIRNYSYFLDAMYLSPFGINAHPYIGKAMDLYTWNLEQYGGHSAHICTGNMGSELRDTLLNSQIEAHITYLVTWLTNYYIPQTNPLNRIATMRAVGQNNLFQGWSASGAGSFDTTTDPYECSLGSKISSSIEGHSKGESPGSYPNITFNTSDPEYLVRKADYIDSIVIRDLPCNDCRWINECPQKVNIFTLLQRGILSPMEEAYIGMFWEISEYNNSGSNRPRNGPTRYNFVEESIRYVEYFDPSQLYDAIIESNTCVERWYFANGEDYNPSWSSDRFRRRLSAIMRLSESNRSGLLKEALNDKSEFVWIIDNVTSFKTARKAEKPDLVQVRFEEDTTTEHEIVDILQDEEHNAQLTSEERTLHWATTMGGSTNL